MLKISFLKLNLLSSISDVKARKKAKHLKCSLSVNALDKMGTYVGVCRRFLDGDDTCAYLPQHLWDVQPRHRRNTEPGPAPEPACESFTEIGSACDLIYPPQFSGFPNIISKQIHVTSKDCQLESFRIFHKIRRVIHMSDVPLARN